MTRRTPTLAGTLAVGFALTLATASLGRAPAPPKPGARPAAAKPAGDAAPSAEEIKKLIDAGSYREALQKLSRALALKGAAAGQYNRHDLLRMKAQSHLNLKDTSSSSAAFAAAAKVAPDDITRAEDRASELVVKRSKNLTFTPKPAKKGDKAEPIEIVDPEKRKAAFAALLADEKAAAAPALKSARGAKTLPPIVDGLKRIGDLRMLELAATGEDAEASKLVDDLAGRAHTLMDDAVQDMADLVKDVEESANDVIPIAVPTRGVAGSGPLVMQSYKKRGLSTRDSQDLRRAIGDLTKIVPTARELARALGSEHGKQFETLAEDAEAVGNQAHKVLTTDYADESRFNARDTRMKRPNEVRKK